MSYKIPSIWFKITAGALAWLIIVAGLHYWLNFDHSKREVVKMGYMPVITNLASPLLAEASKNSEGIRFEAIKFASFAEMSEALRNGKIQAGFMIAPLSIVLRQQGEDVRVVYIGNRHESTLVVKKDLPVQKFSDLENKTIAVPIRFSGHNIAAHLLAEKNGMLGRVKIVEMNPPDMASALTIGALDGYFVGEPFAAQTVFKGHSKVLHYVEEVWPGFICNLLVVRGEFINDHPDEFELLVHGAIRSGLWAQKNIKEAAKIASQYWNQPVELVEYAMTTPPNRIVFNQYTPVEKEMQYLADQMVHFGLTKHNDIKGLVYDRAARSVNTDGITDLKSILAE
ncbi:MAG TPA: ABC transporter substrate-binding protein [Thermodesulfovibrionia bacterium]|nr:ABC transporter substrate-binding protein [Thermodesulfovibrionia bacterium]